MVLGQWNRGNPEPGGIRAAVVKLNPEVSKSKEPSVTSA